MAQRNYTRVRHWKQRFNKNAKFLCRRNFTWDGKEYHPGDLIPKGLEENKGKLRRFWEAQWIELAMFDTPDVSTGRVVPDADPDTDPNTHIDNLPEGVSVKRSKGSWFLVIVDGVENKINGERALGRMLDELRLKADTESDTEGTDGTKDLDSDDNSDKENQEDIAAVKDFQEKLTRGEEELIPAAVAEELILGDDISDKDQDDSWLDGEEDTNLKAEG